MSDRNNEQGKPTPERRRAHEPGDFQGQERRPFLGINLTPLGEKVRNVALGIALVAGAAGVAKITQGNHEDRVIIPITSSEMIEPETAPVAETRGPDDIKVSEINPNNPPREAFNGNAVIRVVSEQDVPHARTSPAVRNNEPNILSWGQISEINGVPITDAMNDQNTELVLESPLLLRNPRDAADVWIAVVSNGKPFFLKVDQETAGFVIMMPNDPNGSFSKNISPDSSALDYGKVSFQPKPQK